MRLSPSKGRSLRLAVVRRALAAGARRYPQDWKGLAAVMRHQELIRLDVVHLAVLFVAAVFAGVMNALAGGGTFFTFPALIALGIPPLVSNATNALCVTPGHALAAVVYKKELSKSWNRVVMCAAAAAIGGIVGAWLLTITNPNVFKNLVPWLVLVATMMFAFQPAIHRWTQRVFPEKPITKGRPTLQGNGPKAWLGYCIASIYGGYFGAGQSIVLMTIAMLSGVEDLQEANGLKNALAAVVSLIAVIVLAFKGMILWNYGLLMIVGAVLGGYGGGKLAKHLSKTILRGFVLVVAVFFTVYYFYATYWPKA